MAYASRFLSRSKQLQGSLVILQQQHAIPVPAFAKEAARPTFKGDEMLSRFSSSKAGKVVDCLKIAKALEAQNIPAAQAEALTVAITGALDSVMEKLEENIATSTGQHSTLVVNEFRKLRADLDKFQVHTTTMQAELMCEIFVSKNKIELDNIKGQSDLHKDYTQLKIDYESAKLQAVKYVMATIASVAAAGFSWFRLMK